MSKISIEFQSNFESDDLRLGHWIVVLRAKNIPPHIGFLSNEKYYSLEYDGLHVANLNTLLRGIEAKSIEALLVKIDGEIDNVDTVMNKYELSDEVTCLFPVRELCAQLNEDSFKAQYVFELIPFLSNNGLIKSVYGLNLGTANNRFDFPVYTKKEIFERIRSLNETSKR